MKRKYLLLLVLCFLQLLVLPAQAAVYYVSPSGSAAWTQCTNINMPCSLNTANINAQAGDTVYLKGGTYSEARNYEGGIMPHNSGTGIGAGRIIFAAATGENPIITKAPGVYMYGLRLGDPVSHAYVKVDGITFLNFDFMAYITNYANHNEIANCIFSGGGGFNIRAFCAGGSSYRCNPTHNWLHGNTFSRGGATSEACVEGGDTFRLGEACCGNDADGETNYNTLEDNLFEYGGHSTLESFGRFIVLRNNVFHNEPWNTGNSGDCTFPSTAGFYTDSSYTGKYGHRNVQMADDWGRPALYNLIEGNRFGYASVNPNNGGADNLDISGPKQIVRYNYFYGSMNAGIRFKYGSGRPGYPGNNGAGGWGGVYNRVFSNTLYHNGYGYPFYETCQNAPYYINTCPQEVSGFIPECYGGSFGTFGNIAKNNLFNGNRHDITNRGGTLDSTCLDLSNNWLAANGDPLFVNPSLADTTSLTLPDLSLQATSPAKDGGTYLTTAVGSGSNSRTLVVNDALYFQDGTWGSELARGVTLFPDWIAIGTVNNAVQISSINYDTNTITLASPMTWASGAPIWLYKKSDGTQVLYGSAPDYGAYEYGGSTPPTCPGTCCSSGQICQGGSFQSSSSCGSLCCTGTCQTPSQTCSDGTPYSQCSTTKPLYCSSGTLTNNCQSCGCPSGQSCQAGGACQASQQYFLPDQFVQAESGALSGMQTGVSGPDTCTYTSTANQGSASFTFNITSAGKYRMEARILANSPDTAGANSWYVGLDSESAQGNDIYTYDTLEATTFTWDNVSLRGPSGNVTWSQYDPMVWDLSAGLHTFTFYGRESNTWLDQIILRKACHKSDSDCSGCVSPAELNAFIDQWKVDSSNPTLRELIEAIGLWKRGC